MLKRNAGREGRGGGEERGECVMREYGGVVNAEAKQDNYVLPTTFNLLRCKIIKCAMCVCTHGLVCLSLCAAPHTCPAVCTGRIILPCWLGGDILSR